VRKWSLTFWTGCLLWAALAAPAAPGAAVTSVTRELLRAAPVGTEGLVSSRFEKFTPPQDEQAVGELYRVAWAPPVGGFPAGTEIVFEFRQQRARTVGRLQIKYPFPIREARSARFRVAGDTFRVGGAVTAWRVTVRTRGTVAAQHLSPSWKP